MVLCFMDCGFDGTCGYWRPDLRRLPRHACLRHSVSKPGFERLAELHRV
jgi:hypothetical protein